jgi:hypothetical protein
MKRKKGSGEIARIIAAQKDVDGWLKTLSGMMPDDSQFNDCLIAYERAIHERNSLEQDYLVTTALRS